MNKRQYKKYMKKKIKILLNSETFQIPHAYKEYYQGRTVPMLLDGLAETVLNLVADKKMIRKAKLLREKPGNRKILGWSK